MRFEDEGSGAQGLRPHAERYPLRHGTCAVLYRRELPNARGRLFMLYLSSVANHAFRRVLSSQKSFVRICRVATSCRGSRSCRRTSNASRHNRGVCGSLSAHQWCLVRVCRVTFCIVSVCSIFSRCCTEKSNSRVAASGCMCGKYCVLHLTMWQCLVHVRSLLPSCNGVIRG